MKLDEKIKSKTMIYDCFETLEAKQYVGKHGYFTNKFQDFANLNKTTYGTLTEIGKNNYYDIQKILSRLVWRNKLWN